MNLKRSIFPPKNKSFSKAILVSFIFSIVGSALNYVFQIVIGNMVTLEEFGMYNSINALAVNVSIVFSPLSILLCQITASNQGKLEKSYRMYIQIMKVALLIFSLILLVGLILSSRVIGRFGIIGLSQWIVVLLLIGVAGLYAMIISVVQGMECFAFHGFVGALLIASKLLFSVVNVRCHMSVAGIIWAIISSYVCMILVLCLFLRKRLIKTDKEQGERLRFNEIIKLYGMTFWVQLLVSFYINGGETILISYLYDDKQVGLYSSAVTLGKISVYATSFVSVVLFPKVASQERQGADTPQMLYKTVLAILLLGGLYSFVLLAGGKQIIPIVFGQKYTPAMKYIGSITFFTIPLGTLSILHHYFLGIRKIKAYGCVLSIVTAIVVGIIVVSTPDIKFIPVLLGGGLYGVLLWAGIYVKKYNSTGT